MNQITKPKDHVKEMLRTADFLVPYSPPLHPSDEDISLLRSREIIVDGYPLTAHLMKNDHKDIKTLVLTLFSKTVPFLPMSVISKTARMFLGDEHLTLMEYIQNGTKIYSWMILLKKGEAMEHFDVSKGNKVSYNGFEFVRINDSN